MRFRNEILLLLVILHFYLYYINDYYFKLWFVLQISGRCFLKMNLFIILSSVIMKCYASWLANHSHDIWADGDFQIIFHLEHFNLQQRIRE